MHKKLKAVFLDKDGTLIQDIPYNTDVSRIKLMPETILALRRFQALGFRLAIISNQPGVALGFFPEKNLTAVWFELKTVLSNAGIQIDGFYYCPHHPQGKIPNYTMTCGCRKPAPGLIIRAASELGADPCCSWMIGDILNDVEAGRRAGCRTILLNRGTETKWQLSPNRIPDFIAPDLLQAARIIGSV